MRKYVHWGVGLALAATALASVAPTSQAQCVTFMDVVQGHAEDTSFVYTNTFGLVGTPGPDDITGQFSFSDPDDTAPLHITFHVPNTYGPVNVPIHAVLTSFTGQTVGPVVYIDPPDTTTSPRAYIRLASWKGTFSAVDPVSGMTTLLSYDFSDDCLTRSGASAATHMAFFVGDTTAGININADAFDIGGYVDAFRSDFLDLANPNHLGWFYTVESMTGSISCPFPFAVNGNGTLQDFTGDPTFQFSYNAAPPVGPPQGCTPGYWKNHTGLGPGNQGNAWAGTGFYPATSRLVDAGFVTYTIPNTTLMLDALSFKGGSDLPVIQPTVSSGSERNLLRAAVAALLNSRRVFGYPLSSAQVVAQVNAAIASHNRNTMLALAEQLNEYNNSGCPLS